METKFSLKAAIDALDKHGGFLPGQNLALCLWLANNPEEKWSLKQKYAAWRILSTYKERLVALDIPYESLPVPPNPFQVTQAAAGVGESLEPAANRVVGLAENGSFYLAFPYDAEIVRAIHQVIPSAEWGGKKDKNDRRWYVPCNLDNVPLLRRFARQCGFNILPEVNSREAELHKDRENQALSRLRGALGVSERPEPDLNLAELLKGFGSKDLSLLPFQLQALRYGLNKKKFFLSLPMGAGKTVIALATLHAANAFPALVITPASVKYNWAREVVKWLPDKSVWVLNGNGLILQDADVTIINYDILSRYQEELEKFGFKAIIADECHRLKNPQTQRTHAASSLVNGSEFRLFLSGTPLINRPTELISQLNMLGQMAALGGQKYYEKFYCAAATAIVGGKTKKKKWIKQFHWNKLEGHERQRREKLLHDALTKTCMFRRSLLEILPELPPVKPIMFPVDLSNSEEYQRADEEFLAWIRETRGNEAMERASRVEQLTKMSYLKQLAGVGKVAAVGTWLRDFLNDTEEKVLVFCEHVQVGVALANEFKAPFVWGGTPAQQRMALVDKFQSDPAVRVLVMSSAMQEGVTLTAARHVAFVQYYWTPAAHDQSIARAYGRVNDPHGVQVYYFYGTDTIDADMVQLLDAKRQTVETILDGSRKNALLSESVQQQLFNKFVERAFKDPQKGKQA